MTRYLKMSLCWQHRCWIFPRDPQFEMKAGRVLDLCEQVCNGEELRPDEFVISADEKTSIQARVRIHLTQPTQSGSPMKVEHEYKRCGAWAYLAAWNVHRAKVFGRCELHSGIDPVDRLVGKGMNKKAALCAVMRKMITLMRAILIHERPYDPQWKKREIKSALPVDNCARKRLALRHTIYESVAPCARC